MKAAGNRTLHPAGLSKSLEASFARVLATRLVKRKQRVQKPRDRASKFVTSQEAFAFLLAGATADAR